MTGIAGNEPHERIRRNPLAPTNVEAELLSRDSDDEDSEGLPPDD